MYDINNGGDCRQRKKESDELSNRLSPADLREILSELDELDDLAENATIPADELAQLNEVIEKIGDDGAINSPPDLVVTTSSRPSIALDEEALLAGLASLKKGRGLSLKAILFGAKTIASTKRRNKTTSAESLPVEAFALVKAHLDLIAADPANGDKLKAGVLKLRPSQVKIAEIFDHTLCALHAGHEPSVYVRRCFDILKAKGSATANDIIKTLISDGYAVGTASSEVSRVMVVFDTLRIATRNGQTLTLNANSLLAQKLAAILSSGKAGDDPSMKDAHSSTDDPSKELTTRAGRLQHSTELRTAKAMRDAVDIDALTPDERRRRLARERQRKRRAKESGA